MKRAFAAVYLVPGSELARAAGCTCRCDQPQAQAFSGISIFVIAEDCPVHGVEQSLKGITYETPPGH